MELLTNRFVFSPRHVAGKPPKHGKKFGAKNTISYGIHHNVKDKAGNSYPPKDKCYITVSPTANSNADLTILYLKKVLLPDHGATEEHSDDNAGVLWDDFRGHSAGPVKEYTRSLDFLKSRIMDGGLTPEGQPLDKVINKVVKGKFRDMFDEWSLNAPINPRTGHPIAPSRQLLAQWVVDAWESIPEEMIEKAWEACGYESVEELDGRASNNSRSLVTYTEKELGSLLERIGGADFSGYFFDEVNGPDGEFPEEEEGDSDEEDG